MQLNTLILEFSFMIGIFFAWFFLSKLLNKKLRYAIIIIWDVVGLTLFIFNTKPIQWIFLPILFPIMIAGFLYAEVRGRPFEDLKIEDAHWENIFFSCGIVMISYVIFYNSK